MIELLDRAIPLATVLVPLVIVYDRMEDAAIRTAAFREYKRWCRKGSHVWRVNPGQDDEVSDYVVATCALCRQIALIRRSVG